MQEKLAKVAGMLAGDFRPDKRNKQQGYDYVSADQVLAKVAAATGEVGIAIVPSIEEYSIDETSYRSGTRYECRVKFVFTIVGEGGEFMKIPWFGVGVDYTSADKAYYKAITSGHKYFLMKLFMIGVGNEDPEHEEHAPVNGPAQVRERNGGNNNENGDGDGQHDEPWRRWRSPSDAQRWALENGFYQHPAAARNGWMKAVKATLGETGSVKPEQLPDIYRWFYFHQAEKGDPATVEEAAEGEAPDGGDAEGEGAS